MRSITMFLVAFGLAVASLGEARAQIRTPDVDITVADGYPKITPRGLPPTRYIQAKGRVTTGGGHDGPPVTHVVSIRLIEAKATVTINGVKGGEIPLAFNINNGEWEMPEQQAGPPGINNTYVVTVKVKYNKFEVLIDAQGKPTFPLGMSGKDMDDNKSFNVQ